jgi:hypothetical protein
MLNGTLTQQRLSDVSLFVLSLFIPIDPDFSVAYTIPSNHRVVDQAHITNRGTWTSTIRDGAYDDASGTYKKPMSYV